jgi:hypothetical protein
LSESVPYASYFVAMSSAESYRRRASEFLALARLAEARAAAAEYQDSRTGIFVWPNRRIETADSISP